MRADYHVHTMFSKDAHSCPEEMIEAGIQRGLQTICITDHMDKDVMIRGEEFIFEAEPYFQKLRELQEIYKEKIEVLIGVEVGMQPHLAEYFKKYVAEHDFDYVIGSVHVIKGIDPYYPEYFEEKSDAEGFREMLDETIENIHIYEDFDSLGHLDYIVRYATNREKEYSYTKYQEQIDVILKYLIEHGKGLEVNSAGLKYGLPFAHPHPDVLRRYVELGGEIITIGSDAHKPEHVAYEFEKIKLLLQECGVKYYTKFKSRKPIFESVS